MIRVAPIAVLGVLAIGPSACLAGSASLNDDDRKVLAGYARNTWRSVDALAAVGPLPADALWRTGANWSPTSYTSPTNIAAYLWSTIAAEGLGLIDHREAGSRLAATVAAVGRLDRSHGFFYNWYDPRTGERVRNWPGGGQVRSFLSTVDNGWLAASLMMVGRVRPELRSQADALLSPMNFGFFYDPHDPHDPLGHPGLLRGGFWPDGGGEFADFHYGVLNTEPRIASYIGIARGDLPAEHYYRMARGAPDPSAPQRRYRDVPVVESATKYRGVRVVPSWDGTMFEALMVPLFVPEAAWSAESWGENHRLYTEAQIEYGLNDARLGFWGISASADGRNGYHAFGVGPLGLSPDAGRGTGGAAAKVITPHASFLALPYAPQAAMANLRNLNMCYDMYTPYGFYDAVDVGTGQVSQAVYVLDQGMIMASIANALSDDLIQRAFSTGMIETAIRPILSVEAFEVGPRSAAPGLAAGHPARPSAPPSPSLPSPGSNWRTVRPGPVAELQPDETEGYILPFVGDDRTHALGARPKPSRKRSGRASNKRRTMA